MSKQKERSSGFFGMGASLLMTVFLVLMLVTFSLMSLASARNDLHRAELLAQRRTEYYDATNQGQMVLSALNRGEDPGVAVTREGDRASFRIIATNGRILDVNLQLQEGFYRIIGWKMFEQAE